MSDFDGLAAPARRGLAAGGFRTLADLAKASAAAVARLHGMGPNAMTKLKAKMADKGLSFAG